MSLLLLKVSRSGRLISTEEFNSLDEIATRLKQPIEIINQIKNGFIFPRGKLCVLNKYIIRPKTIKPPEKIGVIDFS